MKQNKIIAYSLDFDLSNKYLEVIILCLKHKILNEKVEILLVFSNLQNKNSTFGSFLNESGKRCFMRFN